MTVWEWFHDEGRHIKKNLEANATLKKWHADVDYWFDHAMQELSRLHIASTRPEIVFHPKIDVTENKKQYKISVEVPGVHPQDLHVEAENHMLAILGEKKSTHESTEDHTKTRECSYGSFERVLALPEDADMETLQAEFMHGTLHITVNRKDLPSNKKNIDIKVLS